MKFEVRCETNDGHVKSYITQEYPDYSCIEKKFLNDLWRLGFVEEGKTRKTWIPYKHDKRHSHFVKSIEVRMSESLRLVERIDGVQ